MDNASLWYLARYQTAVDLAEQGKRLECLQICWDLRNDPRISLYRRAWVNLLIATNASVRSHPDKSKFAEEAIALAAQIRRNMTVDEKLDAQLQRIETEGRSRLAIIVEEKFMYAAMEGSKTLEEALAAKDIATATIKEMKENGSWPPPTAATAAQSTGTDIKEGGGDIQKSSADNHGALNTWTIEGAFTDFGKGNVQEKAGNVARVEDVHGERGEQHSVGKNTSAADEMSLPVRTRTSD